MQTAISLSLNELFTQQGLPFFATPAPKVNRIYIDALSLDESAEFKTKRLNALDVKALSQCFSNAGIGLEYEYKNDIIRPIKPAIGTAARCRVGMSVNITVMAPVNFGLIGIATFGFVAMRPENDSEYSLTLLDMTPQTFANRRHIISNELRRAYS